MGSSPIVPANLYRVDILVIMLDCLSGQTGSIPVRGARVLTSAYCNVEL